MKTDAQRIKSLETSVRALAVFVLGAALFALWALSAAYTAQDRLEWHENPLSKAGHVRPVAHMSE